MKSELTRIASFLLVISFIPQLSWSLPNGELEQNDQVFNSNPLSPDESATGNIPNGPDYDLWTVPSVRSDQFVCAFLSDLTNSGDPILSAYFTNSPIETTNAEIYNDDGGPPANGFRDSFFCGEKIKQTGSMILRVDGFGSAILTPYGLYHIEVGPNEVVSEAEPNDTIDTAQPITAPAILANGSDNPDFYSFFANIGERIVVMIDGDPGRPNPATPFSAQLAVFQPDGTDVTNSSGGTYTYVNSFGSYSAALTGTYKVRVTRDPASVDGDYRIVVLVDGTPPLVGACCRGDACDQRSFANCRGKFAGVGTTCIGDTDGDGIEDDCDNCITVSNTNQEDNDADDVGNSCDSCIDDPLKISPGACGCGAADLDSNNSGIADCLPGSEVKSLIQGVIANLAKIKDLSSSAGPKAKQAKSDASKLIKSLIGQIQTTVAVAGTQIVVTQSGFDLNATVSSFLKFSSKSLKSRGAALKKNKKKAIKDGQALIAAIA